MVGGGLPLNVGPELDEDEDAAIVGPELDEDEDAAIVGPKLDEDEDAAIVGPKLDEDEDAAIVGPELDDGALNCTGVLVGADDGERSTTVGCTDAVASEKEVPPLLLSNEVKVPLLTDVLMVLTSVVYCPSTTFKVYFTITPLPASLRVVSV